MQQDAVLTAMEQNVATGFAGRSRAFFRAGARRYLQGMFGDPVHGGNEDFAGWDLIGFPGVKLSFGAAEQQMDVIVVPAHKSTADFPIFKGGRTAMSTRAKEADVVVIGLGAGGGTTVLPLARAGQVGLEAGSRFSVRDFPRTRSATTSVARASEGKRRGADQAADGRGGLGARHRSRPDDERRRRYVDPLDLQAGA